MVILIHLMPAVGQKSLKNVISRPIYRYLSSHRVSCPPDNASNHASECSNICWVVVLSKIGLVDGHYDACDTFCWSKITKTVFSRPIYRHLSSHRLCCPPGNVSNDALESSNLCLVLVFSEKTLDNGCSDPFDACCRSKISKNVISRPIYRYLLSHRLSC